MRCQCGGWEVGQVDGSVGILFGLVSCTIASGVGASGGINNSSGKGALVKPHMDQIPLDMLRMAQSM